ncbi:YdcF family protein [Streptomyces sp. NPDC006971]|uniref:YdcF family protein n=1 Tax=Streptomyces sp. NPDC006971 TaxID=3154784 RepID=UPI0033ECD4D6
MLSFVPALMFLSAFALSVRKDRRRFRNAVLLGLTVISVGAGLLLSRPEHAGVLLMLYLVLPLLAGLALSAFLIANGLTMVRKEGRSPANLLSLMTGLSIIALIVLAEHLRQTPSALTSVALAVLIMWCAYFSFLFACFLGYAYLYGRISVRGDVDFVVMLGSGLLGGERVSPLLASRLRVGLRIHDRQVARGGPAPRLLTSGGQGPDEKLSEARAMAGWLVENGAPAAHVLTEERSRDTEENLRFSRAIMEAEKPGYTCVVVTNNFHAFRAAMTARREGVRGQVLGSPTARYFWPSATIREFVAVLWENRTVNLTMAALMAGLGLLLTLPQWWF